MTRRRRVLLILTAFVGVAIGLLVRSLFLPDASKQEVGESSNHDESDRDRKSPLVRPRTPDTSESDSTEHNLFFRVFDYSTKNPIESLTATLILDDTENPLPVTDNTFQVLRRTAVGSVLKLASPGYFTLITDVDHIEPHERAFDLFLVPGTEIAIRCVAGDTRMPIASAIVDLALDDHNRRRSRTDPDGVALFSKISLRSQLSPTRDEVYSLELIASAPEFVEKKELLHLHPDTDWGYVQLILEPSHIVRGVVRDAETGLGIPDATVVAQWGYRIRRRINSLEKPVVSRPDGSFQLPVRRGASHLEVVAGHPAYSSVGLLLERPPENDSELIVELEPGSDVCGTVLDEAGDPLSGVELHLHPLSRKDVTDWMRYAIYMILDHRPDIGMTDEDGSFCLQRVPRGEYRVGLRLPGYFSSPENPTMVVAETPDSWSGALVRGLELHGAVVTADGHGVGGARVSVHRRDPDGNLVVDSGMTRSTDAAGTFRLRGLAPSTYYASVSSPAGRVRDLVLNPLDVELPWTIVLPSSERSELEVAEVHGCLRIAFDVGDGFIVPGGMARIDLYPLAVDSRREGFIEFIDAGEIHKDHIQPGVFRAVVRITGYPPAIGEVDVAPMDGHQCTSDLQYVSIPEGVPVLLDVSDFPQGSDDSRIWIRASSGLVVEKVRLSYSNENGRLPLVLAQGTYQAIPLADLNAGGSGTMFEVPSQVNRPIVVHVPSP